MSKSVNQQPRRQSHRTFTKRYWKQRARETQTWAEFSPENVSRMRLCSAPRRLALVAHKKTGEIIEMHLSMELHHIFGCKAEVPQEHQTVVELWPHQHDHIDPDRHWGFEFIEWRGWL